MAVLDPLIRKYDSIAWIPTIRGCLSLKLLDNTDYMLGDVDKYSVEFLNYKDLHSEKYIVASSLFTFNDSKRGTEYCRTFRFIFRGSINVQPRIDRFFIDYGLVEESDLRKYFNESGILLGTLSVIPQLNASLTDDEVTLLNQLKEITRKKKLYHEAFSVHAESLEGLEDRRRELRCLWEHIDETMGRIEGRDVPSYPIYTFDVALTRDGILLLKDVTREVFRSSYFVQGTPSDYTCNIPLHRLFKTVMNFMKFLFHRNYHHDVSHDTFLPASNLHPVRQREPWSLSGIVKHQMEAFLLPVVKLKRGAFKYFPFNPDGILLYAESFLGVFRKNELISEREFGSFKDFIQQQRSEIALMMRKDTVDLPAGSWILFVLLILAGVFFVFPESLSILGDEHVVKGIGWVIVSICGMCKWRRFHKNTNYYAYNNSSVRQPFLFKFGDSNMDRKQLSFFYQIYVKWGDKRLFSMKLRCLAVFTLILLVVGFLIYSLYVFGEIGNPVYRDRIVSAIWEALKVLGKGK